MQGSLVFNFLLVANALGAAYGFIFYYGAQLLNTNPILWIFVPDCPLYAFLFALTLIMLSEKIKADWLYFVAFVGALKYGFWTMYVLSVYSEYYFTPDHWLLYSVLFVSHVFLFLEPSIFLGKINVKREWLGLAVFWFLLNDVMDYVFKTHPPVPLAHTGEIFYAAVLMSLVFSLFSYWIIKRFEP